MAIAASGFPPAVAFLSLISKELVMYKFIMSEIELKSLVQYLDLNLEKIHKQKDYLVLLSLLQKLEYSLSKDV